MTRGVLGLVGAGAVGPVLARSLHKAGWSIGAVASRSIESAARAVDFIGAGRPTERIEEALVGADLVLLAVPDKAIAAVAEALARTAGDLRRALVLHHSGALTSETLAPLRVTGAAVGSLHPLLTFADPADACRRLEETFLFFEGDDPDRIRMVAEDLGGRPVAIRPEDKVLYHAGAAAACNLAAAMVDLGLELLGRTGLGRDDAFEALLPLLRGTFRNIEERGLPDALTGPVARGDVEVVRAHLTAIEARAPELLLPYVGASLQAVEIGLAKGTLSAETAEELRSLLRTATARAV